MEVVQRPGSSSATVRAGALTALAVAAIAALPGTAGAALVETHVTSPAVVVPHATTPTAAPSPAPAPQSFGPASSSAPSRPAPATRTTPSGGSHPAPTATTVPASASRPPLTPPGRSDPTCGLTCKETWADFAWDQFLVNWTESIQVPLIWNPANFLSVSFAARRAKLWAIKVHDIEVEIKAEEGTKAETRTSDSGSETDDGDAIAAEESSDGQQVAASDPRSCPDPNSREVYESTVGGGSYHCY